MKLNLELFAHMRASFSHRHIEDNNFDGTIDAISTLTKLQRLCVQAGFGRGWGSVGKNRELLLRLIEEWSVQVLFVCSILQ